MPHAGEAYPQILAKSSAFPESAQGGGIFKVIVRLSANSRKKVVRLEIQPKFATFELPQICRKNQRNTPMKAVILEMNPQTPQPTKLRRAVEALQAGGIVAIPTDTVYALATRLQNKAGIERIRRYRKMSEEKYMTFLIESLTPIAEYAHVSNAAFKLIRQLIPGSYTFILPATKAVPKQAMHPRRHTVGIRIPDEPVTLALLRELGEPLLSISAFAQDVVFDSFEDLIRELQAVADVILKVPNFSLGEPSTVLDLTAEPFTIVREGAGMEELEGFLLES